MTRPHLSLNRHLRRVDHLIRRHGCAVQFVADRNGPSWAYSIGFESLDHPEVVVMGIDAASASQLLRGFWYAAVSGSSPHPGRHTELELGGVRCAVIQVHPEHLGDHSDLVLGAMRYWQHFGQSGGDRAFQIVWSDPSGHLPWEPAFDPRFERFQPLLDATGARPHRWPGGTAHE
jgi:hypothetical protein